MTGVADDRIGIDYGRARHADPKIAARIADALGDTRSVLNVGAGTGSDAVGREVTAVEPSAEMISQRPIGTAPALQASAEALPFEDDHFDAAMAIFSITIGATGRRASARWPASPTTACFYSMPIQASLGNWKECGTTFLPGFYDLIPGPYRA